MEANRGRMRAEVAALGSSMNGDSLAEYAIIIYNTLVALMTLVVMVSWVALKPMVALVAITIFVPHLILAQASR